MNVIFLKIHGLFNPASTLSYLTNSETLREWTGRGEKPMRVGQMLLLGTDSNSAQPCGLGVSRNPEQNRPCLGCARRYKRHQRNIRAITGFPDDLIIQLSFTPGAAPAEVNNTGCLPCVDQSEEDAPMQSMLPWGGLLGFLALAGTVSAEPFSVEKKKITLPEAEVRSGPSATNYYPTNTLHKGDEVEVIKNKQAPAGWLPIKPPPGSFSWINGRFVRQDNDHTGVVLGEDTEVLIGSPLNTGPPSARASPLPRGAILTIVGQPLRTSDGSRWLPIQPHPTEMRYIASDAIKDGATPVPAVVAKPQTAVLKGLYDQALAAERNRNVPEAQKLWNQLAQQTPDPNYQKLYRDRAASLAQPGSGTNSFPVSLTGRIVPTGAQATSLYGTPQWSPPGTGSTAASQESRWSGPGRLWKSALQVDGKQVYRLESNQGENLYVIAQPGVALDQYVNRNVNLYGQLSFRGTERITLMTASWVTPVQ
jgi:hypothetical protein